MTEFIIILKKSTNKNFALVLNFMYLCKVMIHDVLSASYFLCARNLHGGLRASNDSNQLMNQTFDFF